MNDYIYKARLIIRFFCIGFITMKLIIILLGANLTDFVFKSDFTSTNKSSESKLISEQQAADIIEIAKSQLLIKKDISSSNSESNINISFSQITPSNGKSGNILGPPISYYKYTDKDGAIVLTDKNTSDNRRDISVTTYERGSGETPISIIGNHAYVEVSLSCQGQSTKAILMVDTGSSFLSVKMPVAVRLQLKPEKSIVTTLADGRKNYMPIATCERVTIGPKTKTGVAIGILPSNEEGGLLGMSFLEDFPHAIDLKAGLIRWL